MGIICNRILLALVHPRDVKAELINSDKSERDEKHALQMQMSDCIQFFSHRKEKTSNALVFVTVVVLFICYLLGSRASFAHAFDLTLASPL